MRRGVLLWLFSACLLWAEGPAINWQECVDQAAKYHPDLIIAKESTTQAKETLSANQSAQGPTVSATANAQRNYTEGDATDSSSASLQVNQTLFDGGQKKYTTQQSKAGVRKARADEKLSSVLVYYKLRQAYIALWQSQENITISLAIAALRNEDYKLIKLRYEAGTEHKGALLTAQANLMQAQADQAAAERSLDDAQVALCVAMGLPEPKTVSVVPPSTIKAPVIAGLEAIAKKHPSYEQALASESIAESALKSAQSSYWPELSLSGSAGVRSTDGFNPKKTSESIGVSASYTLFDGTQRSAGVEKARSVLRAAQANTRSVYNNLFNTLKSSYSNLQTALSNQEVQKEFLQAAQERNRIAQSQYEVGRITYDNWTIIEDNFVNAQKQNLTAQVNALNALTDWTQKTGNIYEE